MKKERTRRLKSGFVNVLEIPRDLAYKEALVTLTGKKELVIENYKSILLYRPERVLMLTKNGRLEILGKSMEIVYYTSDEMKITGYILNLRWINN